PDDRSLVAHVASGPTGGRPCGPDRRRGRRVARDEVEGRPQPVVEARRGRRPGSSDQASWMVRATRPAERVAASIPHGRLSAWLPAKWIRPTGRRICGQNFFSVPKGNGVRSQEDAQGSLDQLWTYACSIVCRLPG